MSSPEPTSPPARSRFFDPGDPASWFYARSDVNPRFAFDTVAGRYVVLCFFQSAGLPRARQMLDRFLAAADIFDGRHALFIGVTVDPEDATAGRLPEAKLASARYFYDFDRTISRAYGASGPYAYRPVTYILDTRLRVLATMPNEYASPTHADTVIERVRGLPPIGAEEHAREQAPVLVIPRVFEPELCARLIEHYDTHGGQDSGFMRDIDGKTVGLLDYSHKRRMDQEILDEELRRACMVRIHDRVAPEIARAYQFKVTRMERYIVACYEGETGGHFRAHRDNTSLGTAHRRFAVSLNLNTGEFEGGCLRFPEFGRTLYTPPRGGAVVFSCSLLHEATPVTSGRRYVFLPFLYDDAAAAIRDRNRQHLAGTVVNLNEQTQPA